MTHLLDYKLLEKNNCLASDTAKNALGAVALTSVNFSHECFNHVAALTIKDAMELPAIVKLLTTKVRPLVALMRKSAILSNIFRSSQEIVIEDKSWPIETVSILQAEPYFPIDESQRFSDDADSLEMVANECVTFADLLQNPEHLDDNAPYTEADQRKEESLAAIAEQEAGSDSDSDDHESKYTQAEHSERHNLQNEALEDDIDRLMSEAAEPIESLLDREYPFLIPSKTDKSARRKFRLRVLQLRYEAITRWDWVVLVFERILLTRHFIHPALLQYKHTLSATKAKKMVTSLEFSDNDYAIMKGVIFLFCFLFV
jgi:hypothetical protein